MIGVNRQQCEIKLILFRFIKRSAGASIMSDPRAGQIWSQRGSSLLFRRESLRVGSGPFQTLGFPTAARLKSAKDNVFRSNAVSYGPIIGFSLQEFELTHQD